MKKSLIFIALGTTTLLSADPYYGGCPNGRCGGGGGGYYNQGYQGQGQQDYYQGQGGPGYQRQAPQGYYQGQGGPGYQGQGPQGYYQGQNNQGQMYRQNDPSQDKQMSSGSDSKMSTVSDDDIAKDIHTLLSTSWFSKGYQDVSFDVNKGNVSLKGSVEKAEDKKKIEDSIRKINGVKQIDNQITVRGDKTAYNYYQPSMTADTVTKKMEKTYPQDYAATDSDKALNSKIRDKISNGWFSKGFESVVINTTDGVVTITGIVGKVEDIQKVGDEVKKVNGVKSVNNQLTVRSK